MKPFQRKMKLTEIQKETYKYILDFFIKNYACPTVTELAIHFNKSRKCVYDRIIALERFGLVLRTGKALKLLGVKLKIEKE